MGKRKGTCRYPGCEGKVHCRGLCGTCYADKDAREKYGLTSKTAKKDVAAPRKRRAKKVKVRSQAEAPDLSVTVEPTPDTDGSVSDMLQKVRAKIDFLRDYMNRELDSIEKMLG